MLKSIIFSAGLALAAFNCLTADAQGFSVVKSPAIPAHITFANQKIDLTDADLRERMDRELTAMAYTHGNTLLQIKRANRYFPIIEPILKKNGVHPDLLYLACIESTMNPRAVSPAKAAGLWQFMPSTGREYGLEVNEYVDERFDPEKETEAACRYLKSALSRYGNWESVAASYNAGMGRITNELKAQEVDSAFDLWLADETMRYVVRLLAAKLIMENPRAYGFDIKADQLYQPREYRTVEVSEPIDDWAAWATKNGSNYREIREHNPWIRAKSLPNKSGKTYVVKIPTDKDRKAGATEPKVFNKAWIGQ